jgi:hypothetical protein
VLAPLLLNLSLEVAYNTYFGVMASRLKDLKSLVYSLIPRSNIRGHCGYKRLVCLEFSNLNTVFVESLLLEITIMNHSKLDRHFFGQLLLGVLHELVNVLKLGK